ncbi:hypothetical protein HPB47_010812 [Ixodes persulcatus]|uniref:Uncharacterized protein n=1 Tax=Ixodes persulcatus TaxID=34615 RepID=A0AC60NY17_IXOPE|nr:hypothetical protein HPB47_010812 [Ixodes persulcatus]
MAVPTAASHLLSTAPQDAGLEDKDLTPATRSTSNSIDWTSVPDSPSKKATTSPAESLVIRATVRRKKTETPYQRHDPTSKRLRHPSGSSVATSLCEASEDDGADTEMEHVAHPTATLDTADHHTVSCESPPLVVSQVTPSPTASKSTTASGPDSKDGDADDAEVGWQTACYRKQRPQQQRHFLGAALSPLSSSDHPDSATDERPKFVIVFRSRDRYDLTRIPACTIQRGFYAALGLHPSACDTKDTPYFRIGKATNTISVTVRNRTHADQLLAMRTLTAHDRAVDLVAHEAMTGDTIRGVAHGINPEDTSETLLRALRSNSHAIINARPLGKNGLALVTFQGYRPPRTIFYYDVIINVTPYSPTTVVCRRCHGLGHKEHVWTRPPRCPDCGCIVSNDHVCERTYSANCRVTTHLATDPKCPVKRKVDQQLQERTRRTAGTTTAYLCTPRVDHRRGSKARRATAGTSRSRSRARTQDSKTVVGEVEVAVGRNNHNSSISQVAPQVVNVVLLTEDSVALGDGRLQITTAPYNRLSPNP